MTFLIDNEIMPIFLENNHIVISLPRYLATSLPRYLATSLFRIFVPSTKSHDLFRTTSFMVP